MERPELPSQVKALLRARIEKKWDSFSWVTLRALISSINHVINLATPRLVEALRARWDEEHPVEANGRWDADRVIDRSDDSSFIVVGDPGEQDASQYVVVPALRDHKDEGAFIVILSDVIYPSGDVNDYADGMYVPYLHLADKPIYALPGNHDWYDGLAGFMWWFCHYDGLPADAYGMRDASWWEWPARMLWRRPSKRKPRLELADKRAVFMPDGPRQPGSYFAIDTRHVRLVCIDTGIKGEIDRQQAEWLVRVSKGSELPNVLLTGKPLWVNNALKPCPVSNHETAHGFASVAAIVEDPAHGYVATIGGDIHNFQSYEIDGIHHIVSGGGGAYTSATHPAAVSTNPRVSAMYPDPADSLRLFARILLPKLWRLERALLATLVGLGTAAGFVALSEGHDPLRRGVLLGGVIALGACLLVRVILRPEVTRTRPYRAFAVGMALLAGVALGLAGWWLAPDRYAENLKAWAALTAGGAVVAWLLRKTGWWRPRLKQLEIAPGWRLAAASLIVAIPVAAFALGAPTAVGAAAVVLSGTAVAGWLLRRFEWWKIGAQVAAYAAQLVAVLLILDGWVLPDSSPSAFWGLWGALIGLGLIVIAGTGVLLVLLFVIDVVTVEPLNRWLPSRTGWGEVGGFGQVLLPFVVAGMVWLEWVILGDVGTDSRRLAVTALMTLVVPIAAAFGLDWIRRRTSSGAYKLVAVAAVAGVLISLAGLGVQDTWIPRAAAAAAVVAAMVLIGILVAHLVFLGAQWMAFDRDAHRDGEQFSEQEAEAVLAWRWGDRRPAARRVRRRANIAFPGASQPSGPLQQKVAEFCDTDTPPFRKNFLVIDGDDGNLRITPYRITGEDDKPASVPGHAIPVPLGGARDELSPAPTSGTTTR